MAKPGKQASVTEEPARSFEESAEQEELGLIQEFWLFLRENKAWWMVPILLALVGLGVLAFLGTSGLAPFIYPLF